MSSSDAALLLLWSVSLDARELLLVRLRLGGSLDKDIDDSLLQQGAETVFSERRKL